MLHVRMYVQIEDEEEAAAGSDDPSDDVDTTTTQSAAQKLATGRMWQPPPCTGCRKATLLRLLSYLSTDSRDLRACLATAGWKQWSLSRLCAACKNKAQQFGACTDAVPKNCNCSDQLNETYVRVELCVPQHSMTFLLM